MASGSASALLARVPGRFADACGGCAEAVLCTAGRSMRVAAAPAPQNAPGGTSLRVLPVFRQITWLGWAAEITSDRMDKPEPVTQPGVLMISGGGGVFAASARRQDYKLDANRVLRCEMSST